MIGSLARVDTKDSTRIMKRLAKHWAHRFAVAEEESYCVIELPAGPLKMEARTSELKLELTAAPESLTRMQEVVAEHVQRMSGSEILQIEWFPA